MTTLRCLAELGAGAAPAEPAPVLVAAAAADGSPRPEALLLLGVPAFGGRPNASGGSSVLTSVK